MLLRREKRRGESGYCKYPPRARERESTTLYTLSSSSSSSDGRQTATTHTQYANYQITRRILHELAYVISLLLRLGDSLRSPSAKVPEPRTMIIIIIQQPPSCNNINRFKTVELIMHSFTLFPSLRAGEKCPFFVGSPLPSHYYVQQMKIVTIALWILLLLLHPPKHTHAPHTAHT